MDSKFISGKLHNCVNLFFMIYSWFFVIQKQNTGALLYAQKWKTKVKVTISLLKNFS